MKIKEILEVENHRPWEMPKTPWKFYQEWNNAIFLHWEVDLEALQEWVPKELEIDLFDGKPWVSVVAFTMEKIRPKYLPHFPPVSDFHEINIRTYVKHEHKTGVFFLSIEGGKRLSCKIAKSISELPYRFSEIIRSQTQYISRNSPFGDRLKIDFQVGQKTNQKTTLDNWLTERYALFQDTEKAINEFEIHHLPWTIHELELEGLDFSYDRFSHLIKGEPNKVQYSSGVQVIAWGKMPHLR